MHQQNPGISNEALIMAIRTATEEVLGTMAGVKVLSHELVPVKKQSSAISGVITLIGMAGDRAGSLSLVCSSDFACRLAGGLLQTEFSSVDDNVMDAMAEVTNMIGGNIKCAIEPELGDMHLSVPTVIFGEQVRAYSASTHHWQILSFESEGGRMYVHMCLPQSTVAIRRAGVALPLPVCV